MRKTPVHYAVKTILRWTFVAADTRYWSDVKSCASTCFQCSARGFEVEMLSPMAVLRDPCILANRLSAYCGGFTRWSETRCLPFCTVHDGDAACGRVRSTGYGLILDVVDPQAGLTGSTTLLSHNIKIEATTSGRKS
jgi:hypothetical protein